LLTISADETLLPRTHPTMNSSPLPSPSYKELWSGNNKDRGFDGREESFSSDYAYYDYDCINRNSIVFVISFSTLM
jgi:hypothetical protein